MKLTDLDNKSATMTNTEPVGFIRKSNPFANMKIADNSFLQSVSGRQPCSKCYKSRKFFCYTCYVPLPNIEPYPNVKLPVKIDIIKHRSEIDGKSTAAHAAILASDDVRVFEYPDIPDYTQEEGVVLIFPCPGSTDVRCLFTGVYRLDTSDNFGFEPGQLIGTLLKQKMKEIPENYSANESAEPPPTSTRRNYSLNDLPVKRAVFIDSTWNQSRGIFKDPKIGAMRCVVLQNRLSQFWRHHKGSPRWYLSTVEAIHQFLLEVHLHAWGIDPTYRGLDGLEISSELIAANLVKGKDNDDMDSLQRPYDGQYDNLLFFFTHMYGLIHTYYDHNKLKAYKRPIT